MIKISEITESSVFIVIRPGGNECNHKRIKNLWVSLDAGNGGNGFIDMAGGGERKSDRNRA